MSRASCWAGVWAPKPQALACRCDLSLGPLVVQSRLAPSHASGLLGEHASPAVIREHDQRQDPPRSTLHCPAGARRPMGVRGLVRGGPHACLDLAFRLAHDLDPSFNLIWRARVFLPSREPSSPRARLRRQRVPTPAGVHGSTRWKGDESRARDQEGRSNAEIFQAREHFSCPADRPSRGTLPPPLAVVGQGSRGGAAQRRPRATSLLPSRGQVQAPGSRWGCNPSKPCQPSLLGRPSRRHEATQDEGPASFVCRYNDLLATETGRLCKQSLRRADGGY